MLTLGVLDLVIGLIFVYLLLCFVCLAINEGIATALHLRAGTLFTGIKQLIEKGDDLAGVTPKAAPAGTPMLTTAELYAHPLIATLHEVPLFGKKLKRPSYIPARTFTLALLDSLRSDNAATNAAASLNDSVSIRQIVAEANLPEGPKRQLLLMIDEARGDVEAAKLKMDALFDDRMMRLSAVYKQRIQLVGVAVAIVVAFALDASTISMARALSANSTMRSALAAEAMQIAHDPAYRVTAARDTTSSTATSPSARQIRALMDTVASIGLPLGMPRSITQQSGVAYWKAVGAQIWRDLPGLLITAFAITLGAPFWFDILNKVVNVRGAGRAPEERPKSPEALPPPRGA